jgi:putative hemolysin
MEITLLFFLILLNGAFAMSEIALVAARKGRLQKLADEGDHGAARALELNQEPTRFLSTVQIGITSIAILNGIVGEAVLAEPLARWLEGQGVRHQWSGWLATAIVVMAITYFSIVLGELVPKRIGQMNPEAIARKVATPLLWLSILAKPFVKLLSGSTHLILHVLGVKEREGASMVEEDIHALLVEGSETGAIEDTEHEMVRNVFRLDDRLLGSLMVPRAHIIALDANLPWAENAKRIGASDHSRYPVVRRGLHDIVGTVTARQLLVKTLKGETPDLTAGLQPPVFVPESLTGMGLLDNFRASGTHLAFVVDEYGEVLGMVTMTDLLEAITGEFKPHSAEDAWALQRDDGSWLLDGLIPIPELKDRLGLKAVPEEDTGKYHTLSGMFMLLLGRLPHTGDKVMWEDWRLEIVDMDGRRIDKVLAIPPRRAPEGGPTMAPS